MTDNIDDLLAELDIDGLDDIDDITDEGARRLVDNIEIDPIMEKDEGINEADKIPREMRGKDLSAFFSDSKNEITDEDVSDVDLDDVDEMLKKAFLDDEDINEDAIDDVMEAVLEAGSKGASKDKSTESKSEKINDDRKENNNDVPVTQNIDDVNQDIDDNDSIDNESNNKEPKDEKINEADESVLNDESKVENTEDSIEDNIAENIEDNVKININDGNGEIIEEDKVLLDKQQILDNIYNIDSKENSDGTQIENSTDNETVVAKETKGGNKEEIKEKAAKEKAKKQKDSKQKEVKEKVPFKKKVTDLYNKLFSNIPDEAYDARIYNAEEALANKKEKDKEKKAKRAEEKKALAEETKAKKAEEKEKKKLEKEAKKKQAAARKKQAKAKKKALAEEELKNEPIGRINKLGAIVVFAFVGLIVLTVVLFASYSSSTIDYVKQSEILMDKGNYELAYINLLKDSKLDKESKLYKQLHTIQMLNKQLSYYTSYISLGDRSEALDALIVGVEKYDANKSKAMKLEIKDEYSEVYNQILKCLKEEFEITASDARKIRDITSDREYSEKIAQVCEESKK